MDISNPNYKAAAAPIAAADAAALKAAIDALPADVPSISFAELRKVLPAGKRAALTDGALYQMALDAGLTVVPGVE